MLALAEFPSDVVVAVRHHHERWSGGGYPDRLAGQDIPLLAQIISVADSYDAITSDRPYRRKLASREAAAELRRAAGGQLSPSVVDALLGIHARELEDILLDRFR
jgi:HD-GYP domain-containing protein (c-di-GMP phosphodiesterase class II)